MKDFQQLNQSSGIATSCSGTTGIRQGWQCPKCGRIISPDSTFCPFCSSSSNSTISWRSYDVVTPTIGQVDKNDTKSMRLRW